MPLSDTVTGRERASGHAEQHRWPGMQAAGEHVRRRRCRDGWVLAGGRGLGPDVRSRRAPRRRCIASIRISCGFRRSR